MERLGDDANVGIFKEPAHCVRPREGVRSQSPRGDHPLPVGEHVAAKLRVVSFAAEPAELQGGHRTVQDDVRGCAVAADKRSGASLRGSQLTLKDQLSPNDDFLRDSLIRMRRHLGPRFGLGTLRTMAQHLGRTRTSAARKTSVIPREIWTRHDGEWSAARRQERHAMVVVAGCGRGRRPARMNHSDGQDGCGCRSALMRKRHSVMV